MSSRVGALATVLAVALAGLGAGSLWRALETLQAKGRAPADQTSRVVDSPAAPLSSTAPSAASPVAPLSSTAPSAAPQTDDAAAWARESSPLEADLKLATIEALKPRGELAAGQFDATIAIPGRASSDTARLSLMLIEDPYAYRRPLAFYRLARALGARVVPTTVTRRVAAGELGALLLTMNGPTSPAHAPSAQDRDILAFFKARASIQNDGTIDALLSTPGSAGSREPWRAPGPSAREIAMSGAPEIETWASWARSLDPAPSESTPLLRDYVEMLVLDYLAANVLRRSAVFDEASGALELIDNETAFPLHADAQAEAPLLARLRECARFPRGLRERLARFDRAAAAAALAPEGFESWLISPRNLVTLDERRAGLLTLIEAKIAESTERAVMSL